MADSALPYRKLPGRGSGIVGTSTVWEGDTHLLFVTSSPVGERYRRFFYADIQAIILRRTKRRMVINIILFILGLALAAILFGSLDEPEGLVDGGIVAGVFFIFIVINFLLGPTCTLSIQTEIQYEQLPTVRRQRRARQILARIQPRIAAAQTVSAATPETLPAMV